MEFEWDENKNQINIKKHGISFERASLVFQDPNHVKIYDSKHSIDEIRYRVLGRVNNVLCVVITYRKNNVIRIISARKATVGERREYLWQ
ncbi:MAG: BrnT family toxin [Selenomonadaceae bacterium]|nr:BrnT family toxin [Selenomonadaceae bacterium]